MSFLNQVVETTKESNKKYRLERAEYERASNVLYDIAERQLKKYILQRANDGYTDATFDVIDDLKLDISGKWSIPELLFDIIFEDAPPVVSRLFHLSNSPFDGFGISTEAKGAGPSSVFAIDWTHAMLQQQSAPPAKPQPMPKEEASGSRVPEFWADAPHHHIPDEGFGNFSQQSAPLTTPRVHSPPGAPEKPNNPVIRNIFADTPRPPLTEQQIIDCLNVFCGKGLYPNTV